MTDCPIRRVSSEVPVAEVDSKLCRGRSVAVIVMSQKSLHVTNREIYISLL